MSSIRRFAAPMACALFLGLPASAQAIEARACFTRSCPPNGYAYKDPVTCMTVKPMQPPFEVDLDCDMMNDAWDIPITLKKAGGGSWPTTDACGNQICLPAIPDPAGPGCGADHYSPRFKKAGGGKEGSRVGQCVFPCGRNKWTLTFVDANGDCVPDKFTKSTWECRDGGVNWPFSGKIKTFVTDLTKRRIVPVEACRTVIPTTSGVGYTITDAVMVPLGTELSTIILNNEPIGEPQIAEDTTESTEQGDGGSTLCNTLTPPATIVPGQTATFSGLLVNKDTVTHTYQISTAGSPGLQVATAIETATFVVAPGGSTTYEIDTVFDGVGEGFLVTYAWAETGDPDDNAFDAAVFGNPPTVPASSRPFWAGLILALGAFGLIALRRRVCA